jgi:dienelactone hydrolase
MMDSPNEPGAKEFRFGISRRDFVLASTSAVFAGSLPQLDAQKSGESEPQNLKSGVDQILQVIPVWPGVAPGSEAWDYPEVHEQVDGPKRAIPRKMELIRNVSRPTLTVFLADPAKANGTAIIVCPGGGFAFLGFDYEGTDVARYLSSLGISAFVLKYRIARTLDPEEKAQLPDRRKAVVPMAIADGQRAIRDLRARAKDFNIQPDRIGIMGFSAGGAVASAVALDPDSAVRANFLVSVYGIAPKEITLPAGVGPLFAAQAADDSFDNTIRLFTAWNDAKISAEAHIYSAGGHGFSMITQHVPVDTWMDRFADWLEFQAFLKPPKRG